MTKFTAFIDPDDGSGYKILGTFDDLFSAETVAVNAEFEHFGIPGVCEHSDDIDPLDYLNDIENENDLERLTDFLDGVEKWVCEYATKNGDYASGYDCLVCEDSIRWRNRLDSWLDDNRSGLPENVKFAVWSEIADGYHHEWHYQSNEYADWSGPGFCIESFDVGECEEQINISDHKLLQELHEKDVLDDLLDQYNGDLHISRDLDWVKNEETDRYEYVGRKTYKDSVEGRNWHHFYGYASPGGAWHAVVDETVMRELITKCIIQYCEEIDG